MNIFFLFETRICHQGEDLNAPTESVVPTSIVFHSDCGSILLTNSNHRRTVVG